MYHVHLKAVDDDDGYLTIFHTYFMRETFSRTLNLYELSFFKSILQRSCFLFNEIISMYELAPCQFIRPALGRWSA